jgi:heme-degrading monooxygenase HmoA
MPKLRCFMSFCIVDLLMGASVPATAAEIEATESVSLHTAAPVQQIRIYELFDGTKAAFLERFREHAVPIMKRYGFSIVAMWESRYEGRPEFVYVLEWESESQMKAAWASFMADEEWSQIKKRTGALHGPMVGAIQDRVLRPVAR